MTLALGVSKSQKTTDRRNIYVLHEGATIQQCSFVFVHSDDRFAKSFKLDDSASLFEPTRSIKEKGPFKSITKLIRPFCQTIPITFSVTEEEIATAGYLCQHLMHSWNDNDFLNKHNWPYGIRAIKCMSAEKTDVQWEKFANPFAVGKHWSGGIAGREGHTIQIDLDEALKEYGCFQCYLKLQPRVQTIAGANRNNSLATQTCCIAVDFKHTQFLANFGHQRYKFHEIAALAWWLFQSAKCHLEDGAGVKESPEDKRGTERYLTLYLNNTCTASDNMPAIQRKQKKTVATDPEPQNPIFPQVVPLVLEDKTMSSTQPMHGVSPRHVPGDNTTAPSLDPGVLHSDTQVSVGQVNESVTQNATSTTSKMTSSFARTIEQTPLVSQTLQTERRAPGGLSPIIEEEEEDEKSENLTPRGPPVQDSGHEMAVTSFPTNTSRTTIPSNTSTFIPQGPSPFLPLSMQTSAMSEIQANEHDVQ